MSRPELSTQRAVRSLFFMQIFSTLGYSILYSSLVLYITQKLQLGDSFATAFTGSFVAFNFTLHVLGGYIGGRLLSYRALFLIGMALQATGCALASYPQQFFLIWGVATFLTGCGLNVVCINCMLTQLFDPEDHRRESAFLWNYSGMNAGFLMGFTISGFLQLQQNYFLMFALASGGSIISSLLAIWKWKHLLDRGTRYSKARKSERKKRTGLALILIGSLCIVLAWLMEHAVFANRLVLTVGVFIALAIGWLAYKEKNRIASRKLWAYLILAFAAFVFWTLYQMAPMGLTLFFERNVDRVIRGISIPPQWMQNINTLVIIAAGPVMASINHRLRKRGHRISVPGQFVAGLLFIGIAFLLLPAGIHFANPLGLSAIGWIGGCYFFMSIGEIFLSPIGYAMIGQLVPSDKQGFAMGAWMMVSGIAATISQALSKLALGSTGTIDPLQTNSSFSQTFLWLGIAALATGMLLLSFLPILRRLIHGPIPSKADEPAPYNAPQD